jgi:hypothetical protein
MKRRALLGLLPTFAFGARAAAHAAVLPAQNIPAKPDLELVAHILKKGSARLQNVLAKAAHYGLQICFTRLANTASGVKFQTDYFTQSEPWFAPASLVKLPLAALLLEQLEAGQIDWHSAKLAFPAMPDCAERALELRQPQAIARLIERALVLSDDSAYCALFDALGPQHISDRMRQMGHPDVRIQARFGACGPENSKITGPVQLFSAAGKLIRTIPTRPPFALVSAPAPIKIGRAWMQADHRIEGAKDFTNSNSAPLAALHDVMLALMRPELVTANRRFQISEGARQFLLAGMRTSPAESPYSSAAEAKLDRTYFRLLGVGDGQWPKDLIVENKVGWAYGFLSDMAHLKQGSRECFVSCKMYLNGDGVLNDGRYEYESIGRPAMAEIGRVLLAASDFG